jgi:hypothetical protein
MSLMLDPHMAWVLSVIVGVPWPEADEDKLRQFAQHWRDFAAEAARIRADAHNAASRVGADNSGTSIDAFSQYWHGSGGPDGHLAQAQRSAEIVAEVLDGFADVVTVEKWVIIGYVSALAAELAATTVAAIFSLGAAEAAAPEEVALTRVLVREAVGRIISHVEEVVAQRLSGEARQLFERMLTTVLRRAVIGAMRGAVVGGLASGAIDFGWQEAQINIFHTQKGFDWGEVVHAGAGGALGGAIGGATGSVLHGGKPQSSILPRIDESARRFSAGERNIANLLQSEGHNVASVPEGAARTPDALVDGVPTEFKSLRPGATNATIRNQLTAAKGQAQDVIIDARGSGLTESEAKRGLSRFLGAHPARLHTVRIVGDGFDLRYSRSQPT